MKIRSRLIVSLILAAAGCLSVLMADSKVYARESSELAYQKGLNYLKQNKLNQAITSFGRAIIINPRFDKAYYNRGRAYKEKGEIDKALNDYTQAIAINSPETIQSAYNNRGQIYEAKGDLDKALEDYTKGIEAMPNPTFEAFRYFKQVLYRNRAEVYLQKKVYDKALEDAQSIEKMGGSVDPELMEKIKSKISTSGFPDALSEINFYNIRGEDNFEKGQFDLAIADYNWALKIDPNDSKVLANRAKVYAAKGDFDKAVIDYSKVVKTKPEDFKAYRDLGLVYIKKGDFDKAIYCFNKTLKIIPGVINDGQFHIDRAAAYFGIKEYDKCWDEINKATALGYNIDLRFLSELKKATGREK